MEQNRSETRLGCVVLASGSARRFGANKLTAELRGETLIRRTLESVPAEQFFRVVVVTPYPEIAALAEAFSFTAVFNPHPEQGVSGTIRLGLTALGPCDAALFQVADQPLLRRESVEKLTALCRAHPDHIVALGHGGVRGNPCLFPARFFPELMELQGDRGGSAVIRAHEKHLLLCETPAEELSDVDTPEALAALGAEPRRSEPDREPSRI